MTGMKPFYAYSAAEQVANHLKMEMKRGSLSEVLPGVKALGEELGVNHKTVKAALAILEAEGILLNRGRGVKRRIVTSKIDLLPVMRVGILFYDSHTEARTDALQLKQAIIDRGHVPFVAPKTMQEDLGMSTSRIKKHVKSFEVDVWIVYAGSFEILQWFATYKVPVFAIYGRLIKANVAGMGIQKSVVTNRVTRQLVEQGHTRIVMFVREERRKPSLGMPELAFLEQLESCGIKTSSYNIPDWEDTPEGLEHCLNNIFQYTRPTALIICDAVLFHSIQNHLSRIGINAPEGISLFCTDHVESFVWVRPAITHINWDYRPTTRRVLQWITNVSMNKEDRKLSYTKAHLVDGDTIGPVPIMTKKG